MKVQNGAKGKVWYGLHFYAGVAEYKNPDGFKRIFLNEDTIRKMDPTFLGCPVFVYHADDVSTDISELKSEADGFVSESFYNEADGKHWAKFITLSDAAEIAINRGWRLSNCYIEKASTSGGVWNGVDYDKEVTDADYEHLAIVPNPRYEESIILTPEQFKKYNADKRDELDRFKNSNEGDNMSVFEFFKRQKVENSSDIEGMSVLLKKSKREVLLSKLINEADESELIKDKPRLVNEKDLVKYENAEMSVGDLIMKLKEACSALEMMKDSREENDEDAEDGQESRGEEDADEVENDDDDKEDMEDKKDKEADKKMNAAEAKKAAEKVKNDLAEKKKKAKAKSDAIRNAHLSNDFDNDDESLDMNWNKVARGKTLFGSGR